MQMDGKGKQNRASGVGFRLPSEPVRGRSNLQSDGDSKMLRLWWRGEAPSEYMSIEARRSLPGNWLRPPPLARGDRPAGP